MGEIRSAWELAMERTKDIKSDPAALRAHEARTRGKRLVGKTLEDPELDIKQALRQERKDEQHWVREGLFSVVKSSITLPKVKTDLERFDRIVEILVAVAADRRTIQGVTDQIRQFLSQYLDDRNQIVEYLRKQYEPRMRQREQQLSQQYGAPVKLDPSNDPEFSKALQDNFARLDDQYQEALTQAKDHLEQVFQK